jgi:uridine kinase
VSPQPYAGLVAQILSRPPRLGRVRLVCVDGPSAAGKTAFAARLAAEFDPPAPVVHTDDLLSGWDDQLTFWDRLDRHVLAPLRAGRPARYRAYDWHRGGFGEVEREVPPAPVVILEGMSAARSAARREASYTVLVTAAADVRLARSLRRDGAPMQSDLEEWRRREDRHFAADATAAHVDLVVDGAAGGPDGYLPLPRSTGPGP